MVLAIRCRNDYSTALNYAALLALILLSSAFLFFDSQQWHFLPFPWYTASANITLHNDLHLTPQADLNPASVLTVNLSSSHAAVIEAQVDPLQHSLDDADNLSSETSHHPAINSSTIEAKIYSSGPIVTVLPPPEILSLRRLESGLRSARFAIGKAVLMEKNGTMALQAHQGQTQDYLPWGPIYKDASVFHRSYVEMERRFKVFIYPEGEKPLVHNGPCKSIYSTEGRFIQQLQHRNPFVTKDPLRAHVFFLPFSITMMVTYLYNPISRDRRPLLHFVKDYVEVVGAKYPFWNRSSGGDHFMLSCHDWGPYISKAHPHLAKHGIRVLCNADKSEGFVPNKDASLPEINLKGGRIPAALGGLSMKERTFLAFFAGQDHGPVRPLLYKYWEGRDEDVKVFHNFPAHEKYKYQEFMKRSKFCLCPGGYEVNSPRIVEAIYNDCIPVIIADKFELPLSDVLNWDAFSFRVMQKDIPDLKRILQAVPESKCEEMQERVRQVKRHFLLNEPPQRYDLFHMILHSVWLRRLNIRLNYQ